jgi:hypothetical protein
MGNRHKNLDTWKWIHEHGLMDMGTWTWALGHGHMDPRHMDKDMKLLSTFSVVSYDEKEYKN